MAMTRYRIPLDGASASNAGAVQILRPGVITQVLFALTAEPPTGTPDLKQIQAVELSTVGTSQLSNNSAVQSIAACMVTVQADHAGTGVASQDPTPNWWVAADQRVAFGDTIYVNVDQILGGAGAVSGFVDFIVKD